MTNLVNSYVKPDGWGVGENLKASGGYKDSTFPGCEYRLPTRDYSLAVNIKITGLKSFNVPYSTRYQTRIQIEFVGDGEPSTFSKGHIVTDEPLKPI